MPRTHQTTAPDKLKLSEIEKSIGEAIQQQFPDAHCDKLKSHYDLAVRTMLLNYVPGLYPADYNSSKEKKASSSAIAMHLAIALDQAKEIYTTQNFTIDGVVTPVKHIDTRKLSPGSVRDAKKITQFIEQQVAQYMKADTQSIAPVKTLSYEVFSALSTYEDLRFQSARDFPDSIGKFELKMERRGNPDTSILGDMELTDWQKLSEPSYSAMLSALLLERIPGLDTDNLSEKQRVAFKDEIKSFLKDHPATEAEPENISTHTVELFTKDVFSSLQKTLNQKLGEQRAL